jgi:calcium permeable stress-gated cation channel
MAIKYLVIVLFFALIIIKPVHDHYPDETHHNGTHPDPDPSFLNQMPINLAKTPVDYYNEADYLWMYLIFTYFFTGLALYLIIKESRRIIEVRQSYLGNQSTITDRTIRLSGIPVDLQSEYKIKNFIEDLEIGKVDSVFLCKDWGALDTLMEKRDIVLRKLERALVEHEHRRREERRLEALPTSEPTSDSDREDSRLLESGHEHTNGDTNGHRPKERLWFGRFNLQYKYVDAIDYYEEKLRRLDEEIVELRKTEFPTMPLAFVTMDSVASCQMAVQAVLDSSPLQLIATPSPAPVDVDWQNTYMPKRQFLFRFWSITALIFVLTLFWPIVLLPIATVIDLDRIRSIWPKLADFLGAHPFGKSLVQTQLPTLIISGLNVAVPYFYSCKCFLLR